MIIPAMVSERKRFTPVPIYEFIARDQEKGCDVCKAGLEQLLRLSDPSPEHCPACGAPIVKCISAPNVGASESGFDDRAKASGFHKLKKTGKGEYEKLY